MQVTFSFAGEITQVLDAIPWVRCASGNVFFRLWMQFSPTRGCFSQMFKKQISKHSSKQIFWHQFCLWKTPSSRFFLFSPLCMPIFFKTFSSSGFWGVKKASCKRFHVFGENWQRNHFPKLTTLWLLLHPNVTNFAIVHWLVNLCHQILCVDHNIASFSPASLPASSVSWLSLVQELSC